MRDTRTSTWQSEPGARRSRRAKVGRRHLAIGQLAAQLIERKGETMALQVTMLELVKAVSESAATDREVVATVVHMVNSGMVQLCGTFRGARFDLDGASVSAAA